MWSPPKESEEQALGLTHIYVQSETTHDTISTITALVDVKPPAEHVVIKVPEELVEAPSVPIKTLPIRDEKQEASTPPFDVVEPHCRKCGGNKLEAPKRHCSGGNGQDKPFIFLDLYKCKDCQMESTL